MARIPWFSNRQRSLEAPSTNRRMRGFVFHKCLVDLHFVFYDPLNKRLRVAIGHKVGLHMLFLDGSTTMFGDDVGSCDQSQTSTQKSDQQTDHKT